MSEYADGYWGAASPPAPVFVKEKPTYDCAKLKRELIQWWAQQLWTEGAKGPTVEWVEAA